MAIPLLNRRRLLDRLAMAAFSGLLIAGVHTRAEGAPPAAPAAPPAAPATPKAAVPPLWVVLETSKGEIVLELDAQNAPISVENFLAYTDAGHYDGTIFHRVIPTFMIQGGGHTPDLKLKPTRPPIKNEYANGLKNVRGTVAFARTNNPDSATSQFFINVKDNPALNGNVARDIPGYAVFAKVVVGMDVVDVIKEVPTAPKPPAHQAVPIEPVEIRKVSRLSEADAKKRIEKAEAAAAKPDAEAPPKAPETPAKAPETPPADGARTK